MISAFHKEVKDLEFSFVHVDVDLYKTAMDCCLFFYDRMARGGIIVLDDYGFFGYMSSEKQAVDDFFRDKDENPICLRTGQCIVIKL